MSLIGTLLLNLPLGWHRSPDARSNTQVKVRGVGGPRQGGVGRRRHRQRCSTARLVRRGGRAAGLPYQQWHHVFEQAFGAIVKNSMQRRVVGVSEWRAALSRGLGRGLAFELLGHVNPGSGGAEIRRRREEEVGVGVMEVEALVCDDQHLWIFHRPLNLLLGVASRVGASVVTPVNIPCIFIYQIVISYAFLFFFPCSAVRGDMDYGC